MKTKSTLLALYIMIANVIDAYLTNIAVMSGSAIELNPLMNYLLDFGSWAFFITKICMVSIAVTLLLYIKDRPAAQKSLLIGSGIYTLVIFIHIIGLLL